MNPLDQGGDLLAAFYGLAGKVAIVTGGGAGLGREIARALAQAGARLVVADIDLEKAEGVAAEIGGDAAAVRADVSDEASVAALFDAAQAAFGAPDILVNNAGIYPNKRLIELSLEEWTRVQDINVKGTFLCTREALARMGRGGRILNISSIASLHPVLKGYAAYGASKGAINSFTRTVALEAAELGIAVNALVLGGVTTQTRPAGATAVTGPATQPGRFLLGAAPPWQHAAAALFLVGPGAAHITGSLIVADGGFSLT